MMLHEAIRLGAMTHPQGYGAPYRDGHTCALGAAACALGVLDLATGKTNWKAMQQRWPVLSAYGLPGCLRLNASLARHITHWNDRERLTREQIADRVEAIERAWLVERTRVLQETAA